MSERVHELQWITVPRRFTPYGEDLRQEVTPITDKWLIASERTWDEIDRVLEGRLEDIQTDFQKPTNRAKNYGLERPASGNMSRILAYSELLDEYRVVEAENHTRSVVLRGEYEERKSKIRKQGWNQGRTRKAVEDLWRTQYNAQVQSSVDQAETAGKVKNLILRKAVVDLFSATGSIDPNHQPLVTQGFAAVVGESLANFENSRSPSNAFKTREPVGYLLQGITNYLSSTKDRALFAKYNYRQSKGLIETRTDCRVLSTMLDLVIGGNNRTNGEGDLLESLGKNYFRFLLRRAQSIPEDISSGSYPNLSLIYDIYMAALYLGRSPVTQQLGKFVDNLFRDVNSSQGFRQETTNCMNREIKLKTPLFEFVARHPAIISTPSFRPDVLDRLPADIKTCFESPEYRIINGFMEILLAGDDSITGSKEVFVNRCDLIKEIVRKYMKSSIRQVYEHLQFQGYTLEECSLAYDYAQQIPGFSMLTGQGVELVLQSLLGSKSEVHPQLRGRVVSLSDEQSSQASRIKALRTIHQASQGSENSQGAFLHYYLTNLFKEPDDEELKVIEAENAFLWEEVLNNPIWFVSPRGDRFSVRNDDELSSRLMDSVTFNINRAYPREHLATTRLSGVDQPFQFWLDTDKNLLGGLRQIIGIKPPLRQKFSNLLLKRLYFVTSGLSALETVPGNRTDEGTAYLEYKRAHYRFLTSTPERPITLESWGAQAHAREILEIYGIDIYAENKRRRALGTLVPNQYLTFVREVDAGFAGQLVLPNDLVYKPELLQIPV